jgi:chemosensory pili system protein ChpA (sensor histidine kinase/response regulator)
MESKPVALIIEDDEDLNAIFSSALEKAGYMVKSVYDGAMAKNVLAEFVPSLIILDLHMPRVGGDVVLKYIRNDNRLKDVRVIVATADAAFAQAMQFKSEMVLLKPISFSQLSLLASRFVVGRPTTPIQRSEN